MQFTDASTGPPATGWTWYFGDEDFTGTWQQRTETAAWPARSGSAVVSQPNGSVVLLGGDFQRDVWRSVDQGVSWTQMTSTTLWSARGGHAAVTLPDASIVVIGGRDASNNRNDVYRSRNGGAAWRLQTSNGGWVNRANHSAVSLPNGTILMMGGFNDLATPPLFLNDVWQSADYGKTWTQVTANANWLPRCYHSSVVLPDGSIVIMGGRDNSWNLTNEVWRSTDGGATWTQTTAHAGWSARALPGSAVLADGSIVVMGGVTGSGLDQYLNDVWRSVDSGATWTQLTEHAGWSPRIPYGAVAHPDGSLLLVDGSSTTAYRDVWRLQTAGATEQNPTHSYSQNGTYPVTFQAYNGYGVDRAPKQIIVAPIPGDVDQSGTIELADIIKALQVAAGMTGTGVSTDGDVNDDGKIGVAEAIAGLSIIAGLRSTPAPPGRNWQNMPIGVSPIPMEHLLSVPKISE